MFAMSMINDANRKLLDILLIYLTVNQVPTSQHKIRLGSLKHSMSVTFIIFNVTLYLSHLGIRVSANDIYNLCKILTILKKSQWKPDCENPFSGPTLPICLC